MNPEQVLALYGAGVLLIAVAAVGILHYLDLLKEDIRRSTEAICHEIRVNTRQSKDLYDWHVKTSENNLALSSSQYSIEGDWTK